MRVVAQFGTYKHCSFNVHYLSTPNHATHPVRLRPCASEEVVGGHHQVMPGCIGPTLYGPSQLLVKGDGGGSLFQTAALATVRTRSPFGYWHLATQISDRYIIEHRVHQLGLGVILSERIELDHYLEYPPSDQTGPRHDDYSVPRGILN